MISRRTALGGIASAAIAHAQPRKPNFLFLIADDHAGYVLGADGNRLAHTPSLDALSRQGIRFASHFCNSPVCTPSRQCLLTGQLPHAAGVTRLPTPLPDDKPTLARQFAKAGYRTAVFGKMHFNRPGVAGLHGFEIANTEDVLTREWQARPAPRAVSSEIATKPLPWRPFRDPARIWLNADTLPYPRYEPDMRGAFQVRQVEQFLEQHRHDPFALWVSFLEPHSPFDFPIDDRKRFSLEQFQAPELGPEDARQVPLVFRDLTAADKRGIAAAYYSSVEFLDRNIGAVLRKLQQLDLDSRTLVVYTADHGYDLGQHGRFEKHCGYDPALRVPLIMRYPRRIRSGTVHELTEHVDLTATIVDLLGLPSLPVQHGRSLRPYLEGRRMEPRDHIFSEYLENEEAYIRSDRWKFIYCTGKRARQDGYVTDDPTPGRYAVLYDLKADPGEFGNVAKVHPELVDRFATLMLDRFRRTHPEAGSEPRNASREEALDWYLRPRDV